MTLEGWEGFVAVEEFPGIWALYFDRDDDGLVGKVPMGTRVLEVELTRREKKESKAARETAASQPQAFVSSQDAEKSESVPETFNNQDEKLIPLEHENQTAPRTTASFDIHETAQEPWGSRVMSGSDDGTSRAVENSIDGDIPYSPSAVDNRSVWSAAGRNGSEADNVTVATTFSELDEMITEAAAGYRRGALYKAPYVEDGGG
ncbi:hypothetical protein CDD83_3353 [Cordyceps sp. RAO-2017]|nr:hypothetical protein CDD83_3353 [Cordyceps sp. RAO-2017]